MNVKDQMRVLSAIWKKRGYVFLPYIPAAQARIKEQRRANWNEGPAFRWPEDRPKIAEHLEAHAADDLYFSPQQFREPSRLSEYAIVGNRLWADLDEVNPHDIADKYKPTIAWETSPGRYAAVWCMTNDRPNPSAPGAENQRLTSYLGADPSGWDTTQLLRVPGSANNKPGKPRGTRGALVWPAREYHQWDAYDELPVVEARTYDESSLDEQMLAGVDRRAVWARVKPKMHKGIRKFLQMRDTDGLDRSETLWQIERELADAGCTLAEIVAIVRPSVWNKFAGRQDELKRLMIDASKAMAAASESAEGVLDDSEADVTLTPFWDDDDYLNAPEPEWLVPNLVPVGGCGFVAGIPKSLKSWLSLDLSISLTTGLPFLGTAIEQPVNVLYIQEEDPATLVRDRHSLIAGSKDPKYTLVQGVRPTPYPANLFVSVYRGFDGTDLAWHTWLSDTIKEKDVKLVVFDTLATIAPGVDIDSGREVKGELLDPIKDIARDTGAAMLIVHHMTKSAVSERAGQNMAGSGQIHAWADYLFAIKKKEEKTGVITLTFDHETKYTGTQERVFVIDGLDADPRVWNPVEALSGVASPEPEHGPTGRPKAIMLQAIGSAEMADPRGVDADLSPTRKIQRAYIKHLMEQSTQPSIDYLVDFMGISDRTIFKYVKYIKNDYPEAFSEEWQWP